MGQHDDQDLDEDSTHAILRCVECHSGIAAREARKQVGITGDERRGAEGQVGCKGGADAQGWKTQSEVDRNGLGTCKRTHTHQNGN